VDRQKIKLIAAVVLFAAAGGVAWYQLGRKSEAEDYAGRRIFICAKCNQWFPHDIALGEMIPLKCEKCGADASAYEAERCYWGKDGQGKWIIKDRPTFVLVKQRIDPSSTEETKCPDCGREVRPHNPRPTQEQVDRANAEPGN